MINKIMLDGKKHIAEHAVYGAIEKASQKLHKEPFTIFDTAMKNVTPIVEVRPRRIGGASYQIPTEVTPRRKEALAVRWIVGCARERKGMAILDKLALEFIDAFNNTGGAVKKKEETHKMAEANRALAHYSKY
jgi:small subunit ribosomal protein S7